MDADTRRAAARLDRAADRASLVVTILLALGIAGAVWIAFLYYLASRIPGSDGVG